MQEYMKEVSLIPINIMNALLKECKKSDHCHKHAAALVSRNKILYIAHNTQNGHAETNCIRKISPKNKLKNPCILYIIRSNNNKTTINSKPCLFCIRSIQKCNIIKIVYSTDTGFVHEASTTLSTDHISYGSRNFAEIGLQVKVPSKKNTSLKQVVSFLPYSKYGLKA